MLVVRTCFGTPTVVIIINKRLNYFLRRLINVVQ